MPLHCDVRPFSDGKKLHAAAIEKSRDDDIRKSYLRDTDNERFYYAIDSVARIRLHAWIRYRRWVEGCFKKTEQS